MLINLRPLRLPRSRVTRLIYRTYALSTLFLIGLLSLFSAFVQNSPWWMWTAALLFCTSAIVILVMTVPSWLGIAACISFVIASRLFDHWLDSLPIGQSDPNVVFKLLCTAALAYLIAWLRWQRVYNQSQLPTRLRSSFVENLAAGRIGNNAFPYDVYTAAPSKLIPRLADSRRQSVIGIWCIAWPRIYGSPLACLCRHFCQHIGTGKRRILLLLSAAHHLSLTIMDAKLTTVYAISMLLIAQNYCVTRIGILFRTQTQNVTELALLPGFGTHTDAFYKLRKAITMPILKNVAALVATLSIVSLPLTSTPISVIILIVLSGLYGLLFHLYYVLYLFKRSSRGVSSTGFSLSALFIKLLVAIPTVIWLNQCIKNVANGRPSTASQSLF